MDLVRIDTNHRAFTNGYQEVESDRLYIDSPYFS